MSESNQDSLQPLSPQNIPIVLSLQDFLLSPSYQIKPENQKCPTKDELQIMFTYAPPVLNPTVAWPFSSTVTILHLPNSQLTEIDSRIKFFKGLEMLNLSHNLITQLPAPAFWKEFTQLRYVFLNNNRIAHIKNVLCIRHVKTLTHLTLYDNPVVKTQDYRHILLNRITSLVSLDNQVAADDELIEGLKISRDITEWHQQMVFSTDSSLLFDPDTPYTDLVQYLKDIQTETHQILSHHSPLHIVQKVVRSFLVRV